jgi:prepilin-type N-terminal cleavage/methylation domain-containing protein
MKGFPMNRRPSAGTRQQRERAFTLVELMVAMSVFSFATIGLVYVHLFAMKQDELANSKMGASDQSRRGFDTLATDIRSAKIWQVGNGALSSFTPIANGQAQQGTALQLSLSTDTNTYIRYYFDPAKQTLSRMHSGVAGTKLIAQNLTNSMYFSAEDYRGNIQTNLSHKGLIHVMMQFWQYQYPLTKVGPGYFYDFYKMEFRLTSHIPDGP